MPVKALQGTIFKKCDLTRHRPETNKGCREATCQHTCAKPDRCSHKWTLQYQANGRQREESFADDVDATGRIKYGSGKRLAQDAQLKLTHDKRAQVFVDPKRGAVSFTVYATEWISSRNAPNTRRNYEQILRLYLTPALGDRTLRQVAEDREGIQKLISGFTVSQQRTAATLLIGVVSAGVKAGRITSHRLKGLTVDHSSMRAEIIHATRAQLDSIAEALPGEWGLTVWLMRGCGLRIGEALAYNPSCILTSSKLRIHEQVQLDGTKGPLKHRKEGDYRDVPLPKYVAEKLEGFQGFTETKRSRFNHTWRNAVVSASLPSKFVPHTLRHTFASVALANGVPITDVSAWLGHRDINTTYAIYGYLVPESWDRAQTVFDTEYSNWSAEAL